MDLVGWSKDMKNDKVAAVVLTMVLLQLTFTCGRAPDEYSYNDNQGEFTSPKS